MNIRIGLIGVAALAALSCSSAHVGDPERLPSVIKQPPATSTESPELREVGFVSPTSRGAGGSVWL